MQSKKGRVIFEISEILRAMQLTLNRQTPHNFCIGVWAQSKMLMAKNFGSRSNILNKLSRPW